MEFHASSGQLPSVPDDLTIPQFIFDYEHACRPVRDSEIPWFIEEESGKSMKEFELRQRVSGLTIGLKLRYGIGDDDVVCIFSPNHIDYPITIWATHHLGAIISGANPDFTLNELVYQLETTKAKVLIVHPDALNTALAAARSVGIPRDRIVLFNTTEVILGTPASDLLSIDDLVLLGLQSGKLFDEKQLKPGEARTKLAFLNFSSGTTGLPKAVAIPHYSVIVNVMQLAIHNKVNEDYCAWDDRRYRPGDIAIGVLPLYHIYGLVTNLHFVLFSAMSVVICPKYSFTGMLESIVRHKISHLLLVPPQIVLLSKHPKVKDYDLNKYIRMIMSGGAPLSDEVTQKIFELFPNIHMGQGYGLTETCTTITLWPIGTKRGTPGTSGRLVPGTAAKVVKADGSLASYDEPGELYIKTPSAALRYVSDPAATKATFIDGWVRTGDIAKFDRNEEIWVLDRVKEIIKVKGFQVAPVELEGCVLEHKDVQNACVVGIPDEYSGEVPLAFIVPSEEAAARIGENSQAASELKKSIMKHVANNKVAYKHLAGGIEFVTEIPTSPSGKLLRRVLRERAKALRAPKSKL